MKNIDCSFKIVVAVVLAGVVIAFASPGPAAKPTAAGTAPTAVIQASADSAASSTE